MSDQFQFWAITGLITVCTIVLGKFFSSLIEEIKGLRSELGSLNEKMAHVVVNQDWHQKELTRMDNRLSDLERKIS